MTYITKEERIKGKLYHQTQKGFVEFSAAEVKAYSDAEKAHEEATPATLVLAEIADLESQLTPRRFREAIARIEEALDLSPSEVTKTEDKIKQKRKKL